MNVNYFFEVTIIGLILSADSFSAAVAMGHRPFSKRDALRFSFSSGGAEAIVALVGALAGAQIIKRFEAMDHWVAFGILGSVAVHMAYEGIRDLCAKEVKEQALDFYNFTKVLIVSFATSLDAFGVGVGLGVSEKALAPFIVSIGFWAFVSTMAGLHLAKRLSNKFGPIMSIVGSVVLGILAVQMLKI